MHTQTASAIHHLSNFRTNVSDPKKRPRVFFTRPPAAAHKASAAVTSSSSISKIGEEEEEEESRKGQPYPATTSSPVSASRRQRRPQNVDGDFFVGIETSSFPSIFIHVLFSSAFTLPKGKNIKYVI